MDPLSSITFHSTDPAPVTRAAPGARVARDGGRRGQGGEPEAPPRRQAPDDDGDGQPAPDFEAAAEAADDGHHLDVIVDDATDGDVPPARAGRRIDLSA